MATMVEGALESEEVKKEIGHEELNALEILACVVSSYEAKLPSIKKRKINIESLEQSTISKVETDPEQHRVSCHRCGNIRKRKFICTRPNCPHIFCGRCAEKMKEDYGQDVFKGGCPVCRELCCCSNKTLYCDRKNHCYRKCPLSKQRAEEKSEKQDCGKEVVSSPSILSLDQPSQTKDSSPSNITTCLTAAASKRSKNKNESSPAPVAPLFDQDHLDSYRAAILQSQLYNNHYAQYSQAMSHMNPLLGLSMNQLFSGSPHTNLMLQIPQHPLKNSLSVPSQLQKPISVSSSTKGSGDFTNMSWSNDGIMNGMSGVHPSSDHSTMTMNSQYQNIWLNGPAVSSTPSSSVYTNNSSIDAGNIQNNIMHNSSLTGQSLGSHNSNASFPGAIGQSTTIDVSNSNSTPNHNSAPPLCLGFDYNSYLPQYPFPANFNSQPFPLNSIQGQHTSSPNTFPTGSALTPLPVTIPDVRANNSTAITRPTSSTTSAVVSVLSSEEATSSDKSDDTLTSSTATILGQPKYKTHKFTPVPAATSKSLAVNSTLSATTTPNNPSNSLSEVPDGINNLSYMMQPMSSSSNHHFNSLNHMMLNVPAIPLQMYNPETMGNYQQFMSQAFSPFNSPFYSPYMQYSNSVPSIDPNNIDHQQLHHHYMHQQHQHQLAQLQQAQIQQHQQQLLVRHQHHQQPAPAALSTNPSIIQSPSNVEQSRTIIATTQANSDE